MDKKEFHYILKIIKNQLEVTYNWESKKNNRIFKYKVIIGYCSPQRKHGGMKTPIIYIMILN